MTLLTSPPATAAAAPSRTARLGALVVPGALLALASAAVVSMVGSQVAIVHAIRLVVTLH